MKGQKLLSLDIEVIESLKCLENASGFVNDLLKEHFRKGADRNEEELKKSMIQLEDEACKLMDQRTLLESTLLNLQKEKAKLKDKFAKIPKEVLLDFAEFPKMTEDILKNRWCDLPQYKGTNWNNILEAWKANKEGPGK